MEQIAENRIFTVLSWSHTRGEEIAISAGTFSHSPRFGASEWREAGEEQREKWGERNGREREEER